MLIIEFSPLGLLVDYRGFFVCVRFREAENIVILFFFFPYLFLVPSLICWIYNSSTYIVFPI